MINCIILSERSVYLAKNQNGKTMTSFKKEPNKLRTSLADFDEAISKFILLCEIYSSKYPRFIKGICEKAKFYLVHLKYPEDLRKHVYTTNAVESINSIIEKNQNKLRRIFSICGYLRNKYLLTT